MANIKEDSGLGKTLKTSVDGSWEFLLVHNNPDTLKCVNQIKAEEVTNLRFPIKR